MKKIIMMALLGIIAPSIQLAAGDFRDTVFFGTEKDILEALKNKADANIDMGRGNNPLHFLADDFNADAHKKLAKTFIQFGTSLTARNDEGLTPLDIARKKGHKAMTKLLEKAANK